GSRGSVTQTFSKQTTPAGAFRRNLSSRVYYRERTYTLLISNRTRCSKNIGSNLSPSPRMMSARLLYQLNEPQVRGRRLHIRSPLVFECSVSTWQPPGILPRAPWVHSLAGLRVGFLPARFRLSRQPMRRL